MKRQFRQIFSAIFMFVFTLFAVQSITAEVIPKLSEKKEVKQVNNLSLVAIQQTDCIYKQRQCSDYVVTKNRNQATQVNYNRTVIPVTASKYVVKNDKIPIKEKRAVQMAIPPAWAVNVTHT